MSSNSSDANSPVCNINPFDRTCSTRTMGFGPDKNGRICAHTAQPKDSSESTDDSDDWGDEPPTGCMGDPMQAGYELSDLPSPFIPRKWTFKAERTVIDVTRILRESAEAGSEEITINLGGESFHFLRWGTAKQARDAGFDLDAAPMPFVRCELKWREGEPVLVPVAPVRGYGGEQWIITGKPVLNRIKRWLYRPITVQVAGR